MAMVFCASRVTLDFSFRSHHTPSTNTWPLKNILLVCISIFSIAFKPNFGALYLLAQVASRDAEGIRVARGRQVGIARLLMNDKGTSVEPLGRNLLASTTSTINFKFKPFLPNHFEKTLMKIL